MLVNCPLGISGNIINDTFYTERHQNHYMRKFRGFGISVSSFERLKERNVKWIVIKFFTPNKIIFYKCDIEKYYNSEKNWTYSNLQRTHRQVDLQKFVSVDDMEIIRSENIKNDSKK